MTDFAEDRIDIKRIIESAEYIVPKHLKDQAEGYIYIVKANGYHKVGITSDPDKRIKGFHTSIPCDVKLITCIKTQGYVKLERELHKKFIEHRYKGEWFKLNKYQVAEANRMIYDYARTMC